MCGIFGWSYGRKARIPAGQKEIVASALAVGNSLRGDQSWGVYCAGQAKRSPFTRREIGDIADVRGISNLSAFPVIMAHTRYATTGAITRANQHPFRAGKILLAHNGMIFNHEELNRKHSRRCTVDSQHFAHHIDAGLSFNDIEAYGAIEWIEDRAPNTVHLSRLRGGTLHVAGIKGHKGKTVGTVWSSDKSHLDAALSAARLDFFPFEPLKEGEVYEVRDGMLYTTRRACLEVSSGSMTKEEARWARWRTSGARGMYTWEDADGGYSFTGREDTNDHASDTTYGEGGEWSAEGDSELMEFLATHGMRIVDKDLIADRDGTIYDVETVLGMMDAEEDAWESMNRLTESEKTANERRD